MKELPKSEQEALLPRVLPAGWIRNNLPELSGKNGEFTYSAMFEKYGSTRVMINTSIEDDSRRWTHISVSRRNGEMPNWTCLCEVKDTFAGVESLAIQVIPPRHEHYDAGLGTDVAHLWVCLDERPIPDFLAARDGSL